MTDIAALGIAVDIKGDKEAVAGLDKVTGAAKRAEEAASGLVPANSNAAKSLVSVGAAQKSVSAGLQKTYDHVNKLSNAEKALGGQTGNIAAQFSDIGVQLAGGQSPFLIALQQGSQLSAALGSGGGGLKATVGALGAAFASLVSPVSLITVGAIAAAGALYQMFTGASSSADKSAASLKAFDQLVEEIGKRSTDTEAKIKSMLEAPQSLSAINAAAEETKRGLQAVEQEGVQNLISGLRELQVAYRTPLAPEIVKARTELYQMGNALRDNKMAVGDVYEELNRISTADTTPSSLYDTLAALRAIAQGATDAATKLDALGGGAAVKGGRIGSASFDELREIIAHRKEIMDFGARMGTFDWDNLQSDLKSQAAGLHTGSKGSSSPTAYASATQSIEDQTAALRAQNEAQAGLNPLVSDYGFSLAKAKAASDLLAAAERDKRTITADLTNEINNNATALANQTVIQNRNAEATAAAKANLEAAKSAATGFLSTMRQGLVAGEGWWTSFGNAALSVLDKIASAIETNLVNALMGQSGSGFNILSLFGLGASAFPAAPSGGLGAVIGGNSLPTGKIANIPAAQSAAKVSGGGVHITVGVKKSGLNLEPEVVSVARGEAAKAAGQVKQGFDTWRKNGFHNDVEKHLGNRRELG